MIIIMRIIKKINIRKTAIQQQKKCSEFKSTITIACKGKSADAKRIMGVMSLGAKCGDTVEVTIDGEDEAAAKTTLEAFFKENF